MTLTRLTALSLAATLAAPLPASAGSPDNPGEKGELVNARKDYWQDRSGEKDAWGDKVSDIAKDSGGNSEGNLGRYLSFMTGGPNPFSDRGQGND